MEIKKIFNKKDIWELQQIIADHKQTIAESDGIYSIKDESYYHNRIATLEAAIKYIQGDPDG